MTSGPRVARVFVSSTFLDAVDEREVLARRVFPELRRFCRDRGVTFVEVDLRWGITTEDQAEGHVLPICLSEIDRCRPFFIGILCDRYGWRPESFDSTELEQFPWLADFEGCSITELEMLYGALLKADVAEAAFFYRRSPKTADMEDRRAVDRLADRMRQSGLPFRDALDGAEAIGDAVLEDLSRAIERRWPTAEQPDEHDARAAAYRFFATEDTLAYVGRSSDLQRCQSHLADTGPPLVVTAPEGVGKTALLAKLVTSTRADDTPVIEAYLGSVPGGADARQLVTFIVTAARRRLGEGITSDVDPDQLALSLDRCFRSATGKLAIVIDAVDALEDREGALDLGWLPREIPDHVRILLSSRPGRPIAAAKGRGWSHHEITGLEPAERKEVAEAFLARFGKRLEPRQLLRLSEADRLANPLLLRTVLGELRVVGRYDALDEQLGQYLAAPDASHLFRLVLMRLERDLGDAGPDVVRASLTALWASRYGLSEQELAAVAGSREQPLQRRILSMLVLNLGEHVRSVGGRLRLASDAFAAAVAERYLADAAAVATAHERLASYFEGVELGPRKVDEYPWHLERANALERLHAFLAQIPVVLAFPAVDGQFHFELRQYWRALGADADPVATYLESLEAAQRDGLDAAALERAVHELGFFFELVGRSDGARLLRERELQTAEDAFGKGDARTAVFLNNLAELDLRRDGDHARAVRLLRLALAALRRGREGTTELAASILDNLGQAERDPGRRVRATRRALDVRCRLLGSQHRVTLRSMNNLAIALNEMGKYAEAEALALETLRVRTDVLGPFDYDTLATASFVALLELDRGYDEKALELARSAQRGLAAILGDDHRSQLAARTVVEVALTRLGRLDEAEAALAERAAPGKPVNLDQATWANNLGQVRRRQARFTEAARLVRAAIAVAASPARGNERLHVLFQISLGEILGDAGRPKQAETVLDSAEAALQKSSRRSPLVQARLFHARAVAARAAGDDARARRLARRAQALREKYAGMESRSTLESGQLLRTIPFHRQDRRAVQGTQGHAARFSLRGGAFRPRAGDARWRPRRARARLIDANGWSE